MSDGTVLRPPPLLGGRRMRSGREYSLRTAEDDVGEEDLARGRTRSGEPFRRVNRGHYSSIKQLTNVHKRLFSPKPTFVMAGECKS
jgi:hypothetical protein